MTNYSATPSAIVVDANVAVRAILPIGKKAGILDLFADWHQSCFELYAPEILLPEVVSVIRKGIVAHWITEAEGRIAVEDVFQLGLEIVPSDAGMCQSALNWAALLGQSKAYDGFYLAAAERMRAELWTADERLRNRAVQLNLSWVKWI
jgi:predicted nucleic acid-binding protein